MNVKQALALRNAVSRERAELFEAAEVEPVRELADSMRANVFLLDAVLRLPALASDDPLDSIVALAEEHVGVVLQALRSQYQEVALELGSHKWLDRQLHTLVGAVEIHRSGGDA